MGLSVYWFFSLQCGVRSLYPVKPWILSVTQGQLRSGDALGSLSEKHFSALLQPYRVRNSACRTSCLNKSSRWLWFMLKFRSLQVMCGWDEVNQVCNALSKTLTSQSSENWEYYSVWHQNSLVAKPVWNSYEVIYYHYVYPTLSNICFYFVILIHLIMAPDLTGGLCNSPYLLSKFWKILNF